MEQITLDILWNRLVATVNEQAAALMRSSFTSIVRESGDLSAGVFDRRGRMIAQAVTGTPGHINSMATGMVHFLTRFPVDTLRPGDVLVTNDPWKTASQLNDITVATPVFRDGRVVAFFANTCHALDIGGRGLSADARSVFEEGLSIPMMKLHDAGRPVEPLYELIAANVRTPEEVLGDLHSQVVGNEVGARQLHRGSSTSSGWTTSRPWPTRSSRARSGPCASGSPPCPTASTATGSPSTASSSRSRSARPSASTATS